MARKRGTRGQLDGMLTPCPTETRLTTFQIGLLITSASIISSSVYFLWRITTFPEISNVDAILIGVAITTAIFLCAWGIVSGKGNPVESSLLVCPLTACCLHSLTSPVCLRYAVHLPNLYRLSTCARFDCGRRTL